MKFSELIRMAAHNLVSRRGRTALNLFGITLGCTVLMVTAAAGQGVRDAIRVLFDSSPDAKRIFCNKYLYDHFNANDAPPEATKVEGKMSDKRRERISKKLAQRWVQDQYRQRDIPTRLSFDQLSKIRSWPGVARASADVSVYGEVPGADEPIEVTVGIPGELSGVQQPILAGEQLRGEPNEVVIDEYLAYRMGYHSDDELTQLIGKELRFEFEQRSQTLAPARAGILTQLSWAGLLKNNSEKQEFAAALDLLLNNLELLGLNESQRAIFERFRPTETAEPSEPAELKLTTRTFIVRGVFHSEDSNTAWDLFRQHAPGGDSEICADVETVTELYRSQTMEDGFQTLIVEVESTKYLESVEERLENIDQPTMSASRILKRINRGIDESMNVVYAIAAGILLLTAIGVSNTLFVSVLQRTSEFGIMKALGASDRDVLWLMLLEGMICGLIGALIAVLVSLAVAAIGKSLLLDYVSGRLGSDVLSVLISFSPTLITCATLGSILVCGLASILPAWHAARLDPVEAMRR